VLIGHRAELSNCLYNFDCSLVATSSMDKSAKVWDVRTSSCLATLSGHDDEVLDLAFDNNGKKLATASGDTTARVWNVSGDFQQLALMKGHQEEVSKGKMIRFFHINQIIIIVYGFSKIQTFNNYKLYLSSNLFLVHWTEVQYILIWPSRWFFIILGLYANLLLYLNANICFIF